MSAVPRRLAQSRGDRSAALGTHAQNARGLRPASGGVVWSSTTDEGPFNGLLERPALRALIPRSLRGADVLDAGCGSGAQAEWLLGQGAKVIGVDVSPRMIEEARRRCGENGRFLVADLSGPLPLEPASLDGITCSLDHPFGRPLPGQQGGYFDTELVSDTWRKADVEVSQQFWGRTCLPAPERSRWRVPPYPSARGRAPSPHSTLRPCSSSSS